MWKHVRLESDVFCYTVALTVFAGLVSGFAPALQTSRSDLQQELKERGRHNAGSRARQRLRSTLVIIDVALALILLVGAGLVTKGVRALLVVNENLDPQQIVTMHITLPDSGYKTPAQKAFFLKEALGRFDALPGVTDAAVATNVPFGIYEVGNTVSIQGKTLQPGQYRQASLESVSQPTSASCMTQQGVISKGLLGLSYVAVMLSVLGLIALVLAAVGVYGVMAYSVTERTHEIGIRMALGALQRDVLRLILTRGLSITAAGLAIGFPIAWVLARIMAGIFFGVSATDATTFSGIMFLMCAITLLACYIPARRAMRVDPIIALRYE